jgi:hypothetical protein
VTKWLKNTAQVVSDSVVGHLRCTFCWQGAPTPKVSDHLAKDCPLLKRFNTKRVTKNLRPITISHNSIDAHTLKEPVTNKELVDRFEQLKTETTDLLAQLNRRLKVVERGPKRKAEDPAAPVDSRPPKHKKKGLIKNEADDATEAPSKKGKKPGKKGKKAKEAFPT